MTEQPEFIAYAVQDWLREQAVKVIYITLGSPWENGQIESFHYKFRDECLNRQLFGSLAEAKIIIESWRLEYNTERPYSSLRDQTPAEFAARGLEGSRPWSAPALSPSRSFSNKDYNQPWNSTFEISPFWGQVTLSCGWMNCFRKKRLPCISNTACDAFNAVRASFKNRTSDVRRNYGRETWSISQGVNRARAGLALLTS